MHKDFDKWNNVKKGINDREPNFYHEREVRWCTLGLNVGFEQDGTNKNFRRPVLILKGFSRSVCLVVPLTTSKKKNKYHMYLDTIEGKESFAIISQIRLVDTKRIHNRIAVVDEKKFDEIRKAVRDLI